MVGLGGEVADGYALCGKKLYEDMGDVGCVETNDVDGVAHVGFADHGRFAARHVQAHVMLRGELAQGVFEATDAIPTAGNEHGCAAVVAESDYAGVINNAIVLRDRAGDALNEVEAVFAK